MLVKLKGATKYSGLVKFKNIILDVIGWDRIGGGWDDINSTWDTF